MFRSRSSDTDPSGGSADARGRPSRRVQSAVVGSVAITSAVILLLSGALDEPASGDVEPTSETSVITAVPTSASTGPVMISYLTDLRSWTECVTAEPSGSTCGTAPRQPDDAQLNSYLAEVLDWNICAAPRLRNGGMSYAEDACGPQPVSPLDG